MKIVDFKSFFAGLCIFIASCGDRPIQVEIDNEEYRNVYVSVLEKSKVNYEIDQNNVIYIYNETEESLNNKIKEYSEYRERQIQLKNEQRKKEIKGSE